jgi:radical SAM protein with 4Fe4S-binding SPASM domain
MSRPDGPEMGLDIGLGITSRCDMECAHCYSRSRAQTDLSFEMLSLLLDKVKNIRSINLGTGESYMNPEFTRMIELLLSRGIKVSLTSNGSTVLKMTDDSLRALNDVDISIDAAMHWENDIFRGTRSYDHAVAAMERCKDLGVEVSVATCMTSLNFSNVGMMVRFSRQFDANLRVNIYKPVNRSNLTLSYDQFWAGVDVLLQEGDLISCSEPVVNVLLGEKMLDGGCPCGKNSLRVSPDGWVRPCVYWSASDTNLADGSFSIDALCQSEQWRAIRTIPRFCLDCPDLEVCKGGCAARRALTNGIEAPDPYCFRYVGKPKPPLTWRRAPMRDLVHAGYLCTFIVR